MSRRLPDWDCPECGNLVFGSKKECGKCGKWRPRAEGVAPAKKPGDWNCPACDDLNFASRSTCRKCNANKPGNAFVERPGDWKCSGCNELNFGSRDVCRKCSLPKKTLLLCAVCMERDINCSLPCGHISFCMECASNMNKCPFCRQEYNPDRDVKRAFIAAAI